MGNLRIVNSFLCRRFALLNRILHLHLLASLCLLVAAATATATATAAVSATELQQSQQPFHCQGTAVGTSRTKGVNGQIV